MSEKPDLQPGEFEECPFVVIKDRDENICFTGHLVYMTPDIDPPEGEEPHICVVGENGESYVIHKSNDNFSMYVGGLGDSTGSIWDFFKTHIQFRCTGNTAFHVFNIGFLHGTIFSSLALFILYNVLTNL